MSQKKSKEELLAEGIYYYERGYREQALISYERALQLDCNFVAAYIRKGDALLALHRHQEGFEAFERAIQLGPDDAEFRYEVGLSLEYFGCYEKALDIYEQALQLSPKNVTIYASKAYLLLELKQYEKALEAYEQVFSLDQSKSNYYSRGCALAGLQQYDKAIEMFEIYTSNNPGGYYAYYEMGKAYIAMHNYEEAIASFNQFICLNGHIDSDIDIYSELCSLLCKLQRHEEALELCEQALSYYDGSHHYFHKGCILFDLNRYEEASEAFKQAIYRDYRNADIWVHWGNTFERLGKPEGARRCYEEAEYIHSHPKQANWDAVPDPFQSIARIIDEFLWQLD